MVIKKHTNTHTNWEIQTRLSQLQKQQEICFLRQEVDGRAIHRRVLGETFASKNSFKGRGEETHAFHSGEPITRVSAMIRSNKSRKQSGRDLALISASQLRALETSSTACSASS